MNELFKDVAGYEGLYQVSNFGNVRSLNYNHTGQVRVLKPKKQRNGYLLVDLWNEGKRKYYTVHRLVAQAFIENPYSLPEVNHIDENKENNVVTNLEYCEHAYNMTYGTGHQRSAEAQRKKVLQLTLDGKLVKEWSSVIECGRNGFNIGHISDCCNGKRKTHKGFRWMYAEDYYKMFAA